MQFSQLKLIPQLLQAVEAEGYTTPTPIQQKAIPEVMAGRDVVGRAQTGTGKTAAFALPILQRLSETTSKMGRRTIRALILSPTRELASQIAESFTAYGRFLFVRNTVIFGGVSQIPQEKALRIGVDIVVATPGRLLDLMQQGIVKLDQVDTFVLDEADQMFDMGFIHDVKKIIAKLPQKRQTLLFSATMPPEIQKLAREILTNPIDVTVEATQITADKIEQSVYFVEKASKWKLLSHILQNPSITKALVFARTKHGSNRLERSLNESGVAAETIHGNKSQNARERALSRFKSGHARVLVATDVAARGIDIDEVSHVINYDIPNVAESYVHRIGRTARAGAAGIAVSFCDVEEKSFLFDIEKLLQRRIRIEENPFSNPKFSAQVKSIAESKPLEEPLGKPVNTAPKPTQDQRPARPFFGVQPARDDRGRPNRNNNSRNEQRGPRSNGPRSESPRSESPRNDGQRSDAARRSDSRVGMSTQDSRPARTEKPSSRFDNENRGIQPIPQTRDTSPRRPRENRPR